METLPFTIPVPHDRTVIVLAEEMSYFYTQLHRHREIQLTWIQEGEGTLVAGMNMQVFRGGEIYLFGANLPHVFKSNAEYFDTGSQKKVRAVTVFFDPYNQLSGLFALPEMDAVRSFLETHRGGFKVPEHLFTEISSRLMTLLKSEGLDQLMQFLKLMKTLITAQRPMALALGSFATLINDLEGTRVASIYNYLIQNYSKTITLEEVAEHAYMTPNAFCRYFKRHTHYTLVAFLNMVRINEACKLLMKGSPNGIAAVAYSCGFNSLTNFNRVFKSITGQCPRSYKGHP